MERTTFAPMQFFTGSWDVAPRADPSPPIDLRVITWNVWFGGHMFEERRDALLAELHRRRADVIALQEVTDPLLEVLLEQQWVRRDYQVSALSAPGYDVVVLSRLPMRRLTVVPLPTKMGRRLLVAQLACGLEIATVHLESTDGEAARRTEQLGIIQAYLTRSSEDTVLVGDLNFAPDAPLEQSAMDPSFVDAWPLLRSDEPGYTVDTDRNPMRWHVKSKVARKRIDRAMVRSRRWRPTAIELLGTKPIDIDDTFVSDHFGLEVTLRAIEA
jgi:tyrosyl-DNA phosphodiesterase 2